MANPVTQVLDDVEGYSAETPPPAMGAQMAQQVQQGQMPRFNEQSIYAALQQEAAARQKREQAMMAQMQRREQEYAAQPATSNLEQAAMLMQVAGALTAPTKTGSFMESLGNAGTAVSGPLMQQAQAERSRKEKLLQLQMAREKMGMEMSSGNIGSAEMLKLYQLQQARAPQPSEFDRVLSQLSPEDRAKAIRVKAGLDERAGGGNKLPFKAIEEFSEKGNILATYDELGNKFNPEFAGKGLGVIGDVQNWIGSRKMAGYGDQADWWSDYYRQRNQARNALFGSALTKTEAAAFEKTDINPGMDPDQIKLNLDRQREAARRAAYKLGSAIVEQGYERKIVEKALGYDLDQLQGRRPAGDKPAGGDPLAAARDAIKKGAPRDAVIKRLKDAGIDTSGL
jgi:hypothetical protein